MPRLILYSPSGRKKGQITLPKEIFAAKINEQLMAQAVRVYLSNQRRARAKTKSRGEVAYSGRKLWRQKGTGRARHGDRGAPIFVKGGVAHGPTGEQNYQLKLSKKMKRLALFSALTSRLKEKEILVIDGLSKIEPKTKQMAKIIQNLKFAPSPKLWSVGDKIKNFNSKLKISIILPQVLENVIRAGRNIPEVKLLQAKQLNTYEVLNGGVLVFMKESIPVLKEHFLKKS